MNSNITHSLKIKVNGKDWGRTRSWVQKKKKRERESIMTSEKSKVVFQEQTAKIFLLWRVVISDGLATQEALSKLNGAFNVYTASLVSTSPIFQKGKVLDFKEENALTWHRSRSCDYYIYSQYKANQHKRNTSIVRSIYTSP